MRLLVPVQHLLTGTVALPGVAFGTPIQGKVTVAIEGSHTAVAGFGPDVPHLNVGNFINADGPSGTYTFNTTVGAVFSLSLGLQIFADSSILSTSNTADYSNTARLFIDFTEAGAFFNADSGHNYISAAIEPSATPVPAALPLFATGLGALGFLGWRRKKKTAALAT
ncbi:MAG: PEP-CTERM sorting domain-containing protein [Xanthobacteraceae bacterium]